MEQYEKELTDGGHYYCSFPIKSCGDSIWSFVGKMTHWQNQEKINKFQIIGENSTKRADDINRQPLFLRKLSDDGDDARQRI